MPTQVQRTLLGSSHNFNILPIPLTCERDKTIFLSNTGVLYIWHDTRSESWMWIIKVLPTLLPTQWSDEKLQKLYNSLKGHQRWLEFDTKKKTLNYCEIISQT